MDYDIRERIIEESCIQFKRYGIKAVTMDSLASHLGISKRTIYENFSDKDELVMSVMTWMGHKNLELMNTIVDGAESVIHMVFRIIIHVGSMMQELNPLLFEDLKKYHHKVDKSSVRLRVMDNLSLSHPLVEKGVADGIFRDDINIDIVNRAIHSIFSMTGDFDHFPRELFRRDEIVRNVFLNYLRGIATPVGVELINKCESETYTKTIE